MQNKTSRQVDGGWFNKRVELAESLVRAYTSIGIDKMALSSGVGSGKSEFCRDFLIPAMEMKAYKIPFVDFEIEPNDPAMVFAQATLRATGPSTVSALRSLLCMKSGPPNSVSAAKEAINELLVLSKSQPLMVILKEPQLLTQPQHSTFTAMLRSFLHNQAMRSPHPIQALFIGSDGLMMEQLFNRYEEPFYRFTHVESLESRAKCC